MMPLLTDEERKAINDRIVTKRPLTFVQARLLVEHIQALEERLADRRPVVAPI